MAERGSDGRRGGAQRDTGTPQGGVISPILANVYLDEVLDWWFEREVRPRLRGKASIVRYADDFVVVIEREDDAHRVMEVLPKCFERYGLTLHPEKTRLLDFRHPWRRPKDADGPPRAQGTRSFDFLGFTHLWKKTHKGGFAVCQQSASKRLSRALTAINQWCRANRHRPIAEQHGELARRLRGHFGYYDRVGNRSALWAFRYYTAEVWRTWLNRRSQRARLWWHRMERILERFALPRPTTCLPPASANP